jgi:hypothetical protein
MIINLIEAERFKPSSTKPTTNIDKHVMKNNIKFVLFENIISSSIMIMFENVKKK